MAFTQFSCPGTIAFSFTNIGMLIGTVMASAGLPLKKPDPNEVAEKEKRSNLYKMAAARDGINEMHPEIIEKRIQVRFSLDLD